MRPLLPHDYADLSPKAQKEARLAAYSPVGKTPEEFEAAHGFFCDMMLGRRGPVGKCPEGIFYRDLVPGGPPEFHRRLIVDIAKYDKLMVQWPRGACKTTVVTKSVPIWLALTQQVDILILVISEKKVSGVMEGTTTMSLAA